MQTNTPTTQNINAIVQAFVGQIATAVEQSVKGRLQAAVLGALQIRRGPGRPPKNAFALTAAAKPVRGLPKQLCPVPSCKNPAAPVFGMVCAKHKDIPKGKIREYREARRNAKQRKTGRA